MKAIIASDGTPSALEAAKVAFSILRPDTDFLLVTVVPEPVDPMETAGGFAGPIITDEEAAEWARDNREEGNEVLERTAQAFPEHVNVKLVQDDSPGAALCDLARDREADVLVIGASEKSRVQAFLEGSVMKYVTRHAPCPVLIVRHDDHDA